MVIFHSYVSLPKGMDCNISAFKTPTKRRLGSAAYSGATFGWRGSASILPRSLAWIANLSCIANWKIYEHITIKNTWAILQTKWLIFHSLCLFTVG